MKTFTFKNLALASLILLLVCSSAPAQFDERGAIIHAKQTFTKDQASNEKQKTPQYVAGEVIAKFKEGVDPKSILGKINLQYKHFTRIHSIGAAVANFKKDYKLEKDSDGWFWFLGKKYTTIEQIPEEELFKEAAKQMSSEEKSLYRSYIITLGEAEEVENAIDKLKDSPEIEYVQPNYRYQPLYIPADPYYRSSGSWRQAYDDLWGLKKINCEEAWNYSKGEGVLVAVIDTGVDYNHEDLGENIWVNPRETPGNGIDDDRNGKTDDVRGWDFSGDTIAYSSSEIIPDWDPMDHEGHGTHCAGIIAALDNGKGIIGVAPKAKIMPLKIFPNATSVIAAQAIRYAANMGVHVISNSWGPNSPRLSDWELESAITYAYSEHCVIVFAAGISNDDIALYSPANYPKVIAVASTDHNDIKSDFSCFGQSVDIAAPGGDSSSADGPNGPDTWKVGRNILSLRAQDTDLYGSSDKQSGLREGICLLPSFDQNAKYYRARGTSMACPLVAGVAALVKSIHRDWDQEQVKMQLLNTADTINPLNLNYIGSLGAGRINAYKAVSQSPRPLMVPEAKRIDDSLGGDGDGYIEPGETIKFYIALKNNWKDAFNVKASLSKDNPYVSILSGGPVNYGDILPQQTRENIQPYEIRISSSIPIDYELKFSLAVSSNDNPPQEITCLLFVTHDVPLNNSDWTQAGKDAFGTRTNKLATLKGPLEKKWATPLAGQFTTRPSPVILNGTLYTGIDWTITYGWGYSPLYALDTETGTIKWEFHPIVYGLSNPAVYKDADGQNNVIFGDRMPGNGWLYCVTDKGDHPEIKWIYPLGTPIGSSAVINGRYAYVMAANVANGNCDLLSLDKETGQLMWKHITNGDAGGQMVDPMSGDIYYFSYNETNWTNYLTCLRSNGTLRWRIIVGNNAPNLSGVFTPDNMGHLFIQSSYNGIQYLHVVDKVDGSIHWSMPILGPMTAPTYMNNKILGVIGDQLYAYDINTGKVLWNHRVTFIGTSVPALSSDGIMVINSSGSELRAFDINTGEIVFSEIPLAEGAITSPVITNDGFYALSLSGVVLKYGKPCTQPPKIATIAPDYILEGRNIVIKGVNFGQAQGSSRVVFPRGLVGNVVSWKNWEIVCAVPLGTESGQIFVETNTGTSNRYFLNIIPKTDFEPPRVSITSPVEGLEYLYDFNLQGAVSDNVSTINSVAVYFDGRRVANTEVVQGVFDMEFRSKFLFIPAEDGPHTIEIRAIDESDNIGKASVNFIISATPGKPIRFIKILAPNGGETVREGQTIRIRWLSNKIDTIIALWCTYDYGNPYSLWGQYLKVNFPTDPAFGEKYFDWVVSLDKNDSPKQVKFRIQGRETGVAAVSDASDGDITISPNHSPVITPVGSQFAYIGRQLKIILSGSDPDGDSLTFSADSLPLGAAFSVNAFTWTPSASDIGKTYSVKFSVSDGAFIISENVRITVLDATPPIISGITTNYTGSFAYGLEFKATVTDPGSGVGSVTLFYQKNIYDGRTYVWKPETYRPMSLIPGTNTYKVVLTSAEVSGSYAVKYYIRACDKAGNCKDSTATTLH